MANPFLGMFASEPVLVAPDMKERFEACLTAAAQTPRINEMIGARMEADDGYWPAADDWRARYRPYIVKDGILQIPVQGVLLHNFPWQLGSWATGYDYIWRAFTRSLDDGNVLGVALVIDSPGGMVAGNFDLVDRMYARRKEKPIRAYADISAYSAAYSIASVADKINVDRVGGVGSIGVVTMHVDMSKALDEYGLKVTYIFAGKHKVDGNPTEPLADDVKERIQARIDELYDVFVSTVARNRGMEEKAIRDTEALCFTALQAVSNGLADSIGSLDDSVAAFVADLSSTEGDEEMSTKDNAAVDQATVDAARAEGVETGKKAGLAEGAKAERTRISAILNSEQAKGRSALANHLAMETDMAAEAAVAILAKSPLEAKEDAPKASAFENAMNTSENPGVTASGDKGENKDGEDVLANVHAFGVAGFNRKAS